MEELTWQVLEFNMMTDPRLLRQWILPVALSHARQRQPARVGHLVVRALTRPIMGRTFVSPWKPWMVRTVLLLLTVRLKLRVWVTRKLEKFRIPVPCNKLMGTTGNLLLVTKERSLSSALTTPTNPLRN